ncbi:MAG: transcriptional repressor [Desulforhopalus sp.]|nr:transcriptional repressor [Desulforhopalus sp.]
MCRECNYSDLLASAGLEATANRLQVLEVIGGSNCPLAASDIYNVLSRTQAINRVTVYRILDLLVGHNIVERLSTGGRAAYYGLAPNKHHAPHAHFYCSRCGQMDCLRPEVFCIDADLLKKTFSGEIARVEIRVDGICKNCGRIEADERG